jgi:hippurate hydrolase
MPQTESVMLHNDPVTAVVPEVIAWREAIHANPELGFQERQTAAFVAERLRSFGIAVHEGIAGTGVVGVLRKGNGTRTIGLRAELDALPINEKADVPYASRNAGVMHACGHDGHTAMLLGAAKILGEQGDFDGTVHFVFQPAEENEGGSRRMIEAGLLERFSMDAIYSVHNWPGVAFGEIHTRVGPMMAAVDMFELRFTGTGAHAAMPHLGDDPILAAGEFVGSVQRVVSRSVDPQIPLVVSVTQIHGGNVGNVVPGEVGLQGTCRFLAPGLSGHLECRIREIANGVAAAHGVTAALDYRVGYPLVVNSPEAVADAVEAAAATVGRDKVVTDFAPSLGCDDFAYMVQAVGGAYAWVGVGKAGPGEGLHGDRYVFNDRIVPIVLRYWVNLVEQRLPVAGRRAG